MRWLVGFSKNSKKFLEKNELSKEEVLKHLKKGVRRYLGEDLNVDLKKLKGYWEGFFRIRTAKIRIIFRINDKERYIFVKEIDWRGGAYK